MQENPSDLSSLALTTENVPVIVDKLITFVHNYGQSDLLSLFGVFIAPTSIVTVNKPMLLSMLLTTSETSQHVQCCLS